MKKLFAAVLFHWIYTFLSDVVQAGIMRNNIYNSLEFVPALIIGIVFAFILHRLEVKARIINPSKLRIN